jgi:hypothetical protein
VPYAPTIVHIQIASGWLRITGLRASVQYLSHRGRRPGPGDDVRHLDGSRARNIGLTAAIAAMALLLAGPTASAATEAPPVADRANAASSVTTVNPGGVVRWPGREIDRCRLGDLQWQPWGDACWFPVDLLQAPGPLELERVRRGETERTTVTVANYPYPVQRLTVAPEMANPPANQLARIRREGEEVGAVWEAGGPPAFSLPLRSPLDPLPEARSFGSRRFFNDQPRDPHSGIDLSAARGTPVAATERGRVAIAADHFFSGKSVFIDHGDGLVTMYFHLDRIDVRAGESVERGQVIGTLGSTGRVTGPHLHFGVRWHGARVDPTVLLGDPTRVPEVGPGHPG